SMTTAQAVRNANGSASSASKTISTSELARRLDDPSLVVVDVRPTAAYNGWRLQGEARGGHIPGAVAFPVSWLASLESTDLQQLLALKGITRDKTVVVYGYAPSESAALIDKLGDFRYDDVLGYSAGLADWAAEGLPLDSLPNYEKLVSPEWVHRL